MDSDDQEPILKKIDFIDLEIMSIEALGDYISQLRLEIQRVESEIELKKKARIGAENIFRK